MQMNDMVSALRHMQAYADWHYDEWCMAYPGRFIPIGVPPTWDQKATIDDISRLGQKGFRVLQMGWTADIDPGPLSGCLV